MLKVRQRGECWKRVIISLCYSHGRKLIKVETPTEYREFTERFISDLFEEFSKLEVDFPQYESLLNEMYEWDKKNPLEFTDKERNEFKDFIKRLANVLAKDIVFLAYAKALAKNTELIEAVRKVITLDESIVSKDIIVANPLDGVILRGQRGELILKISQTDSVLNGYEDIILPKIELKSSYELKFPVHKLFKWG